MWDSVNFSFQVSGSKDIIQVKLVIGVVDDWIGATLRARPERLSGRCCLIAWEVEQQLLDLIAEVFFEMEASPFNAVDKACWSLVD